MFQPAQTQIKCPNCGQPFMAVLEQIVDGGRDPQAKLRLLSGRNNTATCPNCQFDFRLGTPIIYHDATKELLLVHVPMELGLPQTEQDRMIGAMTNAIVNSLPQEQRKGYLLMPKTMLTFQGMIEAILEADGITREMIEARRARIHLAETFLEADPATWPELAKAHDAELDQDFFAILTTSADAAIANGRQDVAERLLDLREQLLEHTTAGQALLADSERQEGAITAVTEALNGLGESATREDLIQLAARLFGEEDGDLNLQALVGLARPALDYEFFVRLTEQIEAAQGEAKAALTALRERLSELTQAVDQQVQATTRQAVSVLQSILNSEDVEAAVRANLNQIDDAFMALLAGNIEHAERTGNAQAAARLEQVFERIMAVMQESAPPPLRFINELIRQPTLDDARAILVARGREFGPGLVQLMDLLIQELSAQGRGNPTLERMQQLREIAAGLQFTPGGDSGPAPSGRDGRDPDQSPIILPFTRKRPPAN
jgi:hypothetical protein